MSGETRHEPAVTRAVPRTPKGADVPSRREALIAAAITLFAHRPYRDVSVDEIVERAGVAHGMVSYHFHAKQGLFAATVAYIWDDLVAFEQRTQQETQPDDAVRGYLRRHFAYVRRFPDRFAILSQAAQDNGDTKQMLDEARTSHLAELLSVIGCRSTLPPELLPMMRGWNAFVEQTTLEWAAGEVPDAGALVELCLQVLVAALRSLEGARFDRQTQVGALSRVTETVGSGMAGAQRAVSQRVPSS